MNSGMGDQYYNNKKNRDSMIKAGHTMEIEVMIGTIQILEAGTTLNMIGIQINIIQMIEEPLRKETGHMIEAESEIEIIEEDLVGIEDSGSRNRGRSMSRDKSKDRRCYFYRKPGNFIKECQKKKRDQVIHGGQKIQMQ